MRVANKGKIKRTAATFVLLLTVSQVTHAMVSASGTGTTSTIPTNSPFYNSTTTTTLPLVMPSPHSRGFNSFLSVNDVPKQNTYWSKCSYEKQMYCFEEAKVSHVNGVAVQSSGVNSMSPVNPYANCHGSENTNSLDPNVQNPPCALDGSHWMEVGLNANFMKESLANTYHWKLRTGKIEPSILMLGDTQKTVVAGNATDGWTIEIWARPAIRAYLDGCFSATACSATSIASSVSYGVIGYARMLGINESWPSVASESLRSALRGAYVSTNGMSQSWRFSADTFFVTAVSPHFLPPDSSGKSEVTPGFVRVFLPEAYIKLDRGYKDITMVGADRIRMIVSGEKATAKVTSINGGLLVDTGVEHFSAPNPEVSVLKAGEPSLTLVAPSTPVASVRPLLKKGSSRSLSSLARTSVKQKPKWTAKGQCKIVGTKLVASKKAGPCTVKLQVLNSKKRYVTTVAKTYSVS